MKSVTLAVLLGLLAGHSAGAQKSEMPDARMVIPSVDGAVLYKTYCAVCHGIRGDGTGPMAPALKSAVPDLTRIASRNGGVFPNMRIQQIIDGTASSAPSM
jgi:mono/diheme cytochrome c family protein